MLAIFALTADSLKSREEAEVSAALSQRAGAELGCSCWSAHKCMSTLRCSPGSVAGCGDTHVNLLLPLRLLNQLPVGAGAQISLPSFCKYFKKCCLLGMLLKVLVTFDRGIAEPCVQVNTSVWNMELCVCTVAYR